MKYTNIFFDLDDTLIDTAANNMEALSKIYIEYGFDNYYESFNDFYDVFRPFNLLLWKQFEHHEISKNDLKSRRFFEPFRNMQGITESKALEINDAFMFGSISGGRLIKGTIELLDKLKPHYKLHILSNGFEEVQYIKLEKTRLTEYFDKIILSDHVGFNKPHPSFFEYALKETNAIRNKTVMVGDMWHSDMIGAKNSGIDQIWFNPKETETGEFTPTYIVKTLDEIKNILLQGTDMNEI